MEHQNENQGFSPITATYVVFPVPLDEPRCCGNGMLRVFAVQHTERGVWEDGICAFQDDFPFVLQAVWAYEDTARCSNECLVG